jgi:hypothetical protein
MALAAIADEWERIRDAVKKGKEDAEHSDALSHRSTYLMATAKALDMSEGNSLEFYAYVGAYMSHAMKVT